MKKNWMKKLACLGLSLVLLLGNLPVGAFAQDAEMPGATEATEVTEVTEPSEPENPTEAETTATEPEPTEAVTAPGDETEPEETEAAETTEATEEAEAVHDHEYTSEVTDPTCTEQGYTTYTCACGDSYEADLLDATGHTYENGACTGCGAAQWDTDGDGVLEILAIGNSFSVDALEYAYQIAENLGIEEIAIGNLYIGGCTLETHAANAAGDLGKYTYYYNDNGAWTSTGSYKISTALENRSWDYVSLQQGSPVSGVESSYNEDLTNLIAYVQEHSDAKLVWHMTWAYQQNSTHSAFPTYGKDQMTMYNAIVSVVQSKIATNSDFDLIVPNGTAVQNSRTSLLGDTTTRDGYHMSYDYGRYLTGLLFVKTVTGLSIDGVTYAPSGVDAEEKAIAVESVNNAAAKPFAVTPSAYVEEEPEIPEEGYILLQPELYKGAFWHPMKEGRYNELIYDQTNSKQFFATIRFTRETLPVGSIIILSDGWQYRPDGWITDVCQTSREDTIAQSYVVVTEEWWGNYTIRAFNISKVGLPSLANVSEEEVRAAFRIYVPEESHTHTYENGICTGCGEKAPQQLVKGFEAVSSIQPGDARLVDAFNTVSPLIYQDLTLFENCAITALNLFVTGTVVDNDGTNKNDPAIDDSTEYTFDISVIDASSVKAGGHYTIKETYTISVPGSQLKKNDWNTFDVSHLGITLEEGETLGFGSSTSTLEIFYLNKCVSTNLRYFGHKTTTGDTSLSLRTSYNLLVGVEGYSLLADTPPEETHVHNYVGGTCTGCGEAVPSLEGRTISILGASISTYQGASNGSAANTTNSTIANNVKYYPNTTIPEVTLKDTWWTQVANDLDLRLLVNNAWSGSAILLERSGTVGAYVDRCVQLHDDTGDNAGEVPDIICIQMGFNDFSYGKDTLGTANIDYDALITADGYGTPATTMEATAIMLDKMVKRYPNAEIYMFNHFKRIGQSASDTALMEQLNASIATVCARFGVQVVDLYTNLTDPAHIGDGRLHPNKLGMDVITEAVKRTITRNTVYVTNTHTVSFALDGVTADYGDDKIVTSGHSFTATLTAADALAVTVTMGGKDITASAYVNGTVAIDAVTADVTITAKSVHEPKDYRWTFNGTDLVCVNGENALTKNAGTTTDGIFSKTRYALDSAVVLSHDRPWEVEWKCEGTFLNTNGSSGARIFTSDNVNANYNARYVFKSNTRGIIAMGEKTTTGSHNYGIALADHGIDWTALHTYRLENRIAEDGTNMVWLFVDGKEIGPMVNYYVGTTDKKTTSNWLSGKDFLFPYMGTDTHGFTNAAIEYIAVWEGGHTHTYKAAVTAPTCTEAGYTTHTCSICGDSYTNSYVDANGHDYAGISCTVCGQVHSNAANYKGKVISILSASTSTFAGYIPVADGFNLEHRSRYPQDNLLTDVSETWWMQVIAQLDAKLGINDSWAGSQVLNARDTNSGDLGPDAAMASLTRIQNLGANGTPDVILFYGGGNDIGRGVPVGSFDPASVPKEVDLTSVKWDNFADAYVAAIMRLQHFYPDSEIVVMRSFEMKSYITAAKLKVYGPVIQSICDHFGIKCVDLRSCGVTYDMLPDDIHPNAEGMDRITDAVLQKLLEDVPMEPGIHTTWPVEHKLTNAAASRHYYKSTSDGREFAETITGENVSVTVTMGGVDITDTAYSQGVVRIPRVTGALTITAQGNFTADGHLQQLPQSVCPGINLWKTLTPENVYYTADGWGNTPSGNSWSITFPVKEGDRIRATSLGHVSTNGSTANGVRVTWFGETGVLASLSRETVYAEFAKYGYITAPKGAVALNLPMTNNQDHYEAYIVSTEHDYQDAVCSICGGAYVHPELEGHLQQRPEGICSETNLWNALEPENVYYLGSQWGLYSNAPDVHSVTFPVSPGEKLWATSFGPASGDKTANGTRITWFDADGVLKSVAREAVYQEFCENGYITVPQAAIAVNIPMTSGSDGWEIYILELDHNYENGICTGCGKGSHTHVYGSWYTVKEATSTQEGQEQRQCGCGDAQTRKLIPVALTASVEPQRVSVGAKPEDVKIGLSARMSIGGAPVTDLELDYSITDETGKEHSLEEALSVPGKYTITPKVKIP